MRADHGTKYWGLEEKLIPRKMRCGHEKILHCTLDVRLVFPEVACLEILFPYGRGMSRSLSFVRRISEAGTVLFTCLHGVKVGEDQFGNRYFRSRRTPQGARERRWVLYKDMPDPTSVPPEWHGWLHHGFAEPLPKESAYHKPWQRPHQPNLTGTEAAYLPPGHATRGGHRAKTTSDYQAWNPDSAE